VVPKFDLAVLPVHNPLRISRAVRSRTPAMKRLILAVLAVLSLAQGCQGCLGCTSPVDAPNSTLPRTCKTDPPLIEPQKLDILFVIDNSNSMREEQEAVATELTSFIEQIKQAGGVRQDFNVGVVTTSVYQHSNVGGFDYFRGYPGQEGRLRPVGTLLADGGVDPNTGTERLLNGEDPDLVDKLSRLVRQGTGGSGQETPFEALRLALTGDLATTPIDMGGNGGFLRDGARLLVVVLTDEDDCSEEARPSVVAVGDNGAINDCLNGANSLTPVSTYYDILTTLPDGLGGKREVIFTAIGPVGIDTKAAMQIVDNGQVRNIDCPTSNGPGIRIRNMAETFDNTLANLDSICKASFHDTLVAIAELASVSQRLEITNVPDPQMIQVTLTRADGTKEICTTGNQGIVDFTPGTKDVAARITFGNQCKRRADDQSVDIKLLCAI